MKKRKDWNLDDHSIYNRARRRGLYPSDVDRMYSERGGKCDICQVSKPLRGKDGMHIDHCEETGNPRGLLYTPCNKNLMPIVDEDPGLFLRAIVYKHRKVFVGSGVWDGRRLGSSSKEYRRAQAIFIRYRINVEEHKNLYESQNGKCAICEVPKPMRGYWGLRVDHCHNRGKGHVRGLICSRCNANLMRYVDNDPHLIARAFEYKGKKQIERTRRKKHKLFDLAMRAKKTRAFVSWSKTTLCELIVMMAGRPIQEKEINQVLVDIVGHDPRKRIVGILGRICRREHSYIEKWSHNKTESLYVDKHKIR